MGIPYDLSGVDLIVQSVTTGGTTPGSVVSGQTKVNATAAELNLLSGVTGTVAGDITRLAEATRIVSQTAAATTYNNANADQKIFILNRAAGATITLPSANSAGLGCKFRVIVGTALSGGSYIIKVANSSDIIQGYLQAFNDTATPATGFTTWVAGASDDTVTLNGTTTGIGKVGDWMEFVCGATNVWYIAGMIHQNGAEATPFSATV